MTEKIEREIERWSANLKTEYENWKKDWHNWSNNKRKRHGYPMRRKPNNIRRSFWYSYKRKRHLFELIEQTIEETLIERSNKEFFESFVEVKNFNEGVNNIYEVSVNQTSESELFSNRTDSH